jgi:DNA polymerase I-like protein with 3'-5' exonuclease and polymerase domains
VIGEVIRASGYDPDAPTPESIAHTKKVCKKERGVAKTVVLSANYGVGKVTLQQSLSLNGVDLDLDTVASIRSGYWELYAGVKRWEKELKRQWEKNGGWLLDGFGMPVAIAEGYEQDICNRVVQRSGHICLVWWIHFVIEELEAGGIPWKPIIMDLHDEINFQVPDEYADRAVECVSKGVSRLNEFLGATLPLKVDTDTGRTWDIFKCE